LIAINTAFLTIVIAVAVIAPLADLQASEVERASGNGVGVESLLPVSTFAASFSVVSFSGNCSSPLPETARFDSNASGGVSPYNFSWTFGDGSPTGFGQNVSHAYSAYGQFQVTLYVTDGAGDHVAVVHSIDVAPPPCPPPYPPSPSLPPILVILGVTSLAVILMAIGLVWYSKSRRPS
jgi:hypothetical protein